MQSVDFPAANIAIAKDQPQYRTMYAHNAHDDMGTLYFRMKFSPEELEEVNKTGGYFWMSQCTFGKPMNPIDMSAVSPFEVSQDIDALPMDENRTPADVWDRTHFATDDESPTIQTICKNCGRSYKQHIWSTRECI